MELFEIISKDNAPQGADQIQELDNENVVIELDEIHHDNDIHYIKIKLEEIEYKILELQQKMNQKDINIDAVNKLQKSFGLLKKLYKIMSNICGNLKN